MPFAYVISIILWGVLMPILQMRKWDLTEVEWIAQDSTGKETNLGLHFWTLGAILSFPLQHSFQVKFIIDFLASHIVLFPLLKLGNRCLMLYLCCFSCKVPVACIVLLWASSFAGYESLKESCDLLTFWKSSKDNPERSERAWNSVFFTLGPRHVTA